MLYFDHAASTPPHEEVVRVMMEVMKSHYANPSSMHQAGKETDKLIERARDVIGKAMNTKNGDWIFTSGGTESNNLALKGAAKQYRSRGNHIITTTIEHASVDETLLQLEEEGYHVTRLPVNKEGHITVEQVEAALTPDTIIVSVMHVNNEIGTIQPIRDVGELLKRYPQIIFHVDAVQSIGKLPIDIDNWGIDLLSGSAHKLRGPKGIGFLYIRSGLQLKPLLSGGAQELGLRAGTQHVPGVVAAAKALRMAVESMPDRMGQMASLRAELLRELSELKELRMNGCEPIAPHIVHFSYPGMKPEVIIHMLEQQGIMASTKSACSSKEDKPSRVLLALGANAQHASSGVRISFGDEHKLSDIKQLAEALRHIIVQLKPLERSKL